MILRRLLTKQAAAKMPIPTMPTNTAIIDPTERIGESISCFRAVLGCADVVCEAEVDWRVSEEKTAVAEEEIDCCVDVGCATTVEVDAKEGVVGIASNVMLSSVPSAHIDPTNGGRQLISITVLSPAQTAQSRVPSNDANTVTPSARVMFTANGTQLKAENGQLWSLVFRLV